MPRVPFIFLAQILLCSLSWNSLAAEQRDFPPPDAGSLTYLSNWTEQGQVRLVAGEFRQPQAPGSASELVIRLSGHEIWGTVGGRQLGVVALVTDPGGSGTFHELALLVKNGEQWQNTDLIPLGDRIRLRKLHFADEKVMVEMLTHAPGEAYCCPEKAETRVFWIAEDRLIPPAEPLLVDRTWRWLRTVTPGRDRQLPPADGQYTLRFSKDGTVAVVADCNQAGGRYRADNGIISLAISHTTLAICPDDSLDQQFLADLPGVTYYLMEGERLLLGLGHSSGTMIFQP